MGKVFDNPITLNTDWGGDVSTGNLPVSGRRVQELIKNTFAKKGGCVQIKDKKFLQIFADEASMKKYNSDTEKYGDLVVSQVQLPNTGAAQVTIDVELNEESYNAIANASVTKAFKEVRKDVDSLNSEMKELKPRIETLEEAKSEAIDLKGIDDAFNESI